MVKGKHPFLSLLASGRWGRHIRVVHRGRTQVIQTSPDPVDVKSLAQLSWRHMYQKAVALWHALSVDEKREWESSGTARHMTGFAWFMSQALKPNPGLYLPLQGGNMTGDIDMDGNAIEDLPDPGAPQDADTQAARDAAIAAALADCIDSHIHGWDGADWQKLRVESSALHNLRVKLYDGAAGISSHNAASDIAANSVSMVTKAVIAGFDGVDFKIPFVFATFADGISNTTSNLWTAGALHGFNGATWDRLRTYPTGILKVGRAEVGLLTIRRTSTGQVKGSAGKLYWMALNPGAASSIVELSNDTDGSTAVVLDHFDTTRDGHMMTFDPPMEFSTGIYLKTLTNMTSLIAGYL